jgi:hypothetical protein
MMGTNKVPPPIPAGTATMPIKKQVINKASGQNHHGMLDPGTTLSAAKTGPASSKVASRAGRHFVNEDKDMQRMTGLSSGNGLVIQILRMVGLGKEEPALGQQTQVLQQKRRHQQRGG